MRYAIAQLAFARAVVVDRWVVRDRLDEPGDARSEPALKLRASSPGLLEHVMKQAGSDDFVWLPIRAQQRTDIDWMGDERRLVDLAVLIRVAREANLSAACAIGSPANELPARCDRTVPRSEISGCP